MEYLFWLTYLNFLFFLHFANKLFSFKKARHLRFPRG
jgi:hypothetical protein